MTAVPNRNALDPNWVSACTVQRVESRAYRLASSISRLACNAQAVGIRLICAADTIML